MKKILITPRSLTTDSDPALEQLARQGFELILSTRGKIPQTAELMRLLPGCVGRCGAGPGECVGTRC
jgi:D-3-phosphoglycerate dehydrogenase